MTSELSSVNIPNLPNFNMNIKKTWIYKEIEKVGFKRSSPLIRPQSAKVLAVANATAWSKGSANNFKNSNQEFEAAAALTRPSTAGSNRAELFYKTSNSIYNSSTRPSTATFVKPRYLEMEQKVCRFYGYFLQQRQWDQLSALGQPTVESDQCRHVTILYYLVDDTIEINERKVVNSGMTAGRFYRRSTTMLTASPGNPSRPVELSDLYPGGAVNMIGQTFYIADADPFTRDYYRETLGIELSPAVSQPAVMRSDLGVAYSTGLGGHVRIDVDKGTSTDFSNFAEQRANVEKTRQFFKYEGKVLRFECVEVGSREPPYFPDLNLKLGLSKMELIAPEKTKRFIISFHLSSGTMDLLLKSNPNGKKDTSNWDDPKVVIKKTKVPRNWKEAQQNSSKLGGYYEAQHLRSGQTVDLYGRIFLLLSCDILTRRYYEEELGIVQPEDVPTFVEEEVKIVHPIPVLGDGFLAIGRPDDTLGTVFGMPKPRTDEKKRMRNQGRLIRCKAVLCNPDLSKVNRTREFFVTMFLEDDSIQVGEDAKRNSGMWGGTFLKRGKYMNELPPNENAPRPFKPQDLFLGNVICLNGTMFQIIEIDNISLNFCESYPEEFPLSDTQRILTQLLQKCISNRVDLRSFFQSADAAGSGRMSRDDIISQLDAKQLLEGLNDHELLTLLRRFRANDAQQQLKRDFYVYSELCDVLSTLYATQFFGSAPNQAGKSGQVAGFLKSARMKSLQLRRLLRKNKRTVNGTISLSALTRILSKNGLDASAPVRAYIVQNFVVRGAAAADLLKELQKLGVDSDNSDFSDLKVPPRPQSVKIHLKQSNSQSVAAAAQRSQSNLQGSSSSNSLMKNTVMAASLLRGSRVVPMFPNPSGGQDDGFEQMGADAGDSVVINFEKLCDEIYACDWI